MINQAKPLSEVNAQALKVLYREMGVVDAVRFLNQFTAGYGDYTEERERLFGGLTLDDIVSEMKRGRSSE